MCSNSLINWWKVIFILHIELKKEMLKYFLPDPSIFFCKIRSGWIQFGCGPSAALAREVFHHQFNQSLMYIWANKGGSGGGFALSSARCLVLLFPLSLSACAHGAEMRKLTPALLVALGGASWLYSHLRRRDQLLPLSRRQNKRPFCLGGALS